MWGGEEEDDSFPSLSPGSQVFRWLVLRARPALLSALSSPSSSRAQPPLVGRQRESAGEGKDGKRVWGVVLYGVGENEESTQMYHYWRKEKKKKSQTFDTWHLFRKPVCCFVKQEKPRWGLRTCETSEGLSAECFDKVIHNASNRTAVWEPNFSVQYFQQVNIFNQW